MGIMIISGLLALIYTLPSNRKSITTPPRSIANLTVRSNANNLLNFARPILQESPRSATLSPLLVKLFQSCADESSYEASLAGLSFSLIYTGDSLSIKSIGYSENHTTVTCDRLKTLRCLSDNGLEDFDFLRDEVRNRQLAYG